MLDNTSPISQGTYAQSPSVPTIAPKQPSKVVNKKSIVDGIKKKIESKPRTIIPQEEYEDANSTDRLDNQDAVLHTINGIHLGVYEYFDVSPSFIDRNQTKQLQTISDWVVSKGDVKSGLKKLQSLEMKLGTNVKESRISPVYNWIRIKQCLR